MTITVETYSGYKGSERPTRFRLNGEDYLVTELLAQWCEPGEECFRLRASDGRIYVLRHRTDGTAEEWTVD